MLLIARKTINSVGAEFLTVLPDHSFFCQIKKVDYFSRLTRLRYCGKQQKQSNPFKQLAFIGDKKHLFSLEALLACISGRLGWKYVSLPL